MANESLIRARKNAKIMIDSRGFERHLRGLEIVSADRGKLVAELPVVVEHLNHYNGMHGGCIAFLVDAVTSICQITFDEKRRAGVSVAMNINFLKTAMLGETIVIEAENVKLGKNLGFLECVITNKKDNSVIATATQTKFTGEPFHLPVFNASKL